MNIGVLGGTFDPIHIGHLIVAEEARLRLGLSQVIFVPAGEPWLKEHRIISLGEHRLEMIRLAIVSNPSFRASTVDLERPSPSYTVDTLTDLKRELGEEADFYFILGLDALAEFSTWREPERILEMCRLVAVKRPEVRDLDLESLERSIPGISRRAIILDNTQIGISSSEIRERLANGLPIRYLVPDAVERYIREQGLYASL
ncbi:MAG: nicotinate-nucleotide adenylyltransferase [Dehalococcoidia bacterium]|nr:MAG: nicotinate-nucleotide adenylyltransferase [Dehalococcoidia bacterium]